MNDLQELKTLQQIRDEARQVLKQTAYFEYKLKDKIQKRERYAADAEYREHVKAVVKRHRDKKRDARLAAAAAATPATN